MTESTEQTTIQKLAVLLPHLAAHNNEHLRDLEKWIERIDAEGADALTGELRDAAKHMRKTGERFQSAISILNGQEPIPHDHHKCCGKGHHNHHDHGSAHHHHE